MQIPEMLAQRAHEQEHAMNDITAPIADTALKAEAPDRELVGNRVRAELDYQLDELQATIYSLINHVDPLLLSDPRPSEPGEALVYLASTEYLRSFEEASARVRGLTNLVSRLRGCIEV